MAASWIRINELISCKTDLVCIVARIQSINAFQRTLILYDDDNSNNNNNNEISSSSVVHVSFVNLRTPSDIQSSNFQRGQYVQIYGTLVRQGAKITRIDAQFIRQLGFNFDFNEYIKGLILTRNYMANADNSTIENEFLFDNGGNAIRTIL